MENYFIFLPIVLPRSTFWDLLLFKIPLSKLMLSEVPKNLWSLPVLLLCSTTGWPKVPLVTQPLGWVISERENTSWDLWRLDSCIFFWRIFWGRSYPITPSFQPCFRILSLFPRKERELLTSLALEICDWSFLNSSLLARGDLSPKSSSEGRPKLRHHTYRYSQGACLLGTSPEKCQGKAPHKDLWGLSPCESSTLELQCRFLKLEVKIPKKYFCFILSLSGAINSGCEGTHKRWRESDFTIFDVWTRYWLPKLQKTPLL